jgi:hypothetical protein
MQQIQHQTLDFTIILQVTKHDDGPWIEGMASTDLCTWMMVQGGHSQDI